MRKKQVESNPYIYTLSKLFRFLAMKYQFLIHNRVVFRTAAGVAVSYAKGMVSQKNECVFTRLFTSNTPLYFLDFAFKLVMFTVAEITGSVNIYFMV